MEQKIETSIVSRGDKRAMQRNMETTIVYSRAYRGIMEQKMETTTLQEVLLVPPAAPAVEGVVAP